MIVSRTSGSLWLLTVVHAELEPHWTLSTLKHIGLKRLRD